MLVLKNFKVKFYHETGPKRRTHAIALDFNNTQRAIATAQVHPNDNYCKEAGRKVVLARLMKKMGMTREQRFENWEEYRKSAPKGRWSAPCTLNLRSK